MANKVSTIGSGAILDAVYSANEQWVAVATLQGIAIHSTVSLKRESFFSTESTPIRLSVSPSNRLIAYSTIEHEVHLVNLESQNDIQLVAEKEVNNEDFVDRMAQGLYMLGKQMESIYAMAFSHDEKLLATGGHSPLHLKGRILSRMTGDKAKDYTQSLPTYSIILWDLNNHGVKHMLLSPSIDNITGLGFSKDAKYLISWAGRHGPLLWDIDSGKLIRDFNHKEILDIAEVALSPDGKYLASIGWDAFSISDFETGELVARIPFPADGAPDWLLAAWERNINSSRQIEALKLTIPGYIGHIKSVEISPDCKSIASGCEEPVVRVWDIDTAKQKTPFEIPIGREDKRFAITDIKYSPNGRLLAAILVLEKAFTSTGKLVVWRVDNGKITTNLDCDAKACIEFSPLGKQLAIAGIDKKVQVVDYSGETIRMIWEKENIFDEQPFESKPRNCIRYSQDGKFIASNGSNGSVFVWRAVSGDRVIAEVFARASSTLNKVIPSHISHLAFSRDGKELIVRHDDELTRLDVTNGNRKRVGQKEKALPGRSVIASSFDSRQLAFARSSRVEIWDLEGLIKTEEINGHLVQTNCISFSPDNRLLVTGGDDGLIHVWELATKTV